MAASNDTDQPTATQSTNPSTPSTPDPDAMQEAGTVARGAQPPWINPIPGLGPALPDEGGGKHN